MHNPMIPPPKGDTRTYWHNGDAAAEGTGRQRSAEDISCFLLESTISFDDRSLDALLKTFDQQKNLKNMELHKMECGRTNRPYWEG